MAECLVGQKFNRLTIVEELSGGKCKCVCDCGKEKFAKKSNIKANLTTSCGCAKRKEDLTGKVFSYLTVVEYKSATGYLCKCECGNECYSTAQQLNNGNKKSCGKCNIKDQEFEASMIGKTFNELTVISKTDCKETYKVDTSNRFWNCKCSCGKEIVLPTNKLKTQKSCGHVNVAHVHNKLTKKHKYIYKKWHHFKSTNRLSQEFLEFKTFLDHVLNNLGEREGDYAFLSEKDTTQLVSPENLVWKYNQHTKTICDIDYKWCSNCERYVQDSDKFWAKKKAESCKRCIKAAGLKLKYNLEYKDYLALLNKCNRQCQICSSKDRLVVDHCHSSGKIRGILCSNCNSGLGQFSDNVEYIRAAIEYLNGGLTDIKYNVAKSKTRKQGKICPITNGNNIVVDHCHETNLVRGIIDFNINIAIGLFQDNIQLLKNSINYLERSSCSS